MLAACTMLAILVCLPAGRLAAAAPAETPPAVESAPSAVRPAPPAAPGGHGLLVVGVGDSITYGTGTSHPPATSFLARAAGHAYASYVDLGIPAALTAQIATEVPSIPLDARVVVVYAGTNDVSAAADFRADAPTAIRQAQYFEPSFDALVAAVRARVPAARLIVVTVRDFGRVQREANLPEDRFIADARTAATHEWDAHQRAVAMRNGATVLDLETDAQWYVAGEYGGAPGDVHPNDAGAERLGRAVSRLIGR